MKKAILATKVGMTQIFNENWRISSSHCSSGWSMCYVTQVKTVENDGYECSSGRFCR